MYPDWGKVAQFAVPIVIHSIQRESRITYGKCLVIAGGLAVLTGLLSRVSPFQSGWPLYFEAEDAMRQHNPLHPLAVHSK
jgi:hypothetical protein